jgi:hypothetical protein
MTLNPKLQAAATSYARALIAAALPVWVATNDWKATSTEDVRVLRQS